MTTETATAAVPSLRETLEAAHASQKGDAAPAAEVAAAPDASAPANDGAAPAGAEAGDRAARDAHGRFAPKAQPEAAAPGAPAATEQKTETPPGAEPEQAIRVPASIPAALKADFKNLPPAWREAIATLEGSVQTAKADWGQKANRLNRFDELMAPRQERFALAGIDEVTAVQQLLAASDFLDRDPVNALIWLARDRGVNLAQLVQQTNGGGQPGQHQAQLHPDLQALQGQVQNLQTQLQQRTEADESARKAAAAAEIDTFRSDPKNLYFADVAQQIGHLLATEQASTLQEAYDMAIWASPTIRPLLVKEQTAQAQREREAADRAKAQQAQRAAGSVTGAPGAASAPAAGSKGNIRADLEAARAQLSGRV